MRCRAGRGLLYIITKDMELFFRDPAKEKIYDLFMLTAFRLEFSSIIVVYTMGQILF